MNVQPVTLGTANTFVHAWHRHSRQVVGHLFSLGLFGDDLALHGVAIVGRPVARALDDGHTAEVLAECAAKRAIVEQADRSARMEARHSEAG